MRLLEDQPEQDETFHPDSGIFGTASSLLDTALFLEGESGRRVATSFVMTVPFSRLIGGREYFHVYVVTARHCTTTRNGQFQRLTARCSWMGDLGIMSAELHPDNWSTIKFDELCQSDDWVDEEWIDVALQRLDSGLYSDEVVGRSIRAVRADRSLTLRREFYSDVTPIGLSTVTAGLLQFVPGDSRRLEPMAHFGRLAMVPAGTVKGAWGKMAAYLVESSASRGMSGAPVFAQLETGGYELLGVHVGHFKERQEGLGGETAKQDADDLEARASEEGPASSKAGETSAAPESGEAAGAETPLQDDDDRGAPERSFAMHSQVGLVAPAYKLMQILDTQSVRDSRAQAESAVERSAWRFLDPGYRQQAGVCLPEALYEDLAEYESRHPYDQNFLIIRPTDEQWLSDRRAGEGFDPWSEVSVGALGAVDNVMGVIQTVTGVTSPARKSSDGKLLHLDNERQRMTLYLDESNGVEAIEVRFSEAGSDRLGIYSLARALHGIVQDVRRV